MSGRDVQLALVRALVRAGLRGTDDQAPGQLPTPACVVGMPAYVWETQGLDPDEASLSVFLVVDQDEHAAGKLAAELPRAIEAIESVENAVVVRADPGVFMAGTTGLPCYNIRTEVGL